MEALKARSVHSCYRPQSYKVRKLFEKLKVHMPRRVERLMRMQIGAAVGQGNRLVNNFEHSRHGVFWWIIDKANVTKRCGRWGQIRQGLTGHWQDVEAFPPSEVGATQGF